MTIFHPATFCCRSGLESDFPYRTDIGIGEDLCFIFEIVLAEKSICIIPKSLFNWRKVQNIDSIEQGNQSAEYLASFESKLLIYDVIANTGRMSSDIGDYINSRYFRERFLYREILRDGNFDDLSRKQVIIGDDKIEEIRNLHMSIVWRLKLKLIRLQRIYELIGLFGFIGALRMIVYFVFFAGAHYFVPFSLKKRLLND